MRIAYLGNFEPRTPRGELFSTESHLAASLELLGHEVVRLQENRVRAEDVAALVRTEGAELFLWTKTGDWLRGDAAAMLKAIPCKTASYHLDLFAPLPRGNDIATSPWWHTAFVFSADGDPRSEAFFAKHGVNHHWMPPGVFGPECCMVDPPDRFDVVFVGSGANGYHPEWPYRKQLIDWLRTTYGSSFHLFGRGGDKESVRGWALNELYASAKVVVGDSLCLGFEHQNYWSDRIPETLGRGGFLIHPAIGGLDYQHGKHLSLYQFGRFEELKQQIDYYLENQDARDAIRRAGHEYVKANHTYQHRMRKMLETIFP